MDETRPLLQGARLTAWEMKQAKIPATLIVDNVAAVLMQQRKIDAVIVGADRIAMNGDVANKVGTYSLAVLAKHHEIPFYVAAPVSTIDIQMSTGKDIPIEERDAREVTESFGKRTAPESVNVYSPAFDVTPSKFVTAIVTDQGVHLPPFSESLKGLNLRREHAG
jgi:methylthioribose-1-phosphate isomerase